MLVRIRPGTYCSEEILPDNTEIFCFLTCEILIGRGLPLVECFFKGLGARFAVEVHLNDEQCKTIQNQQGEGNFLQSCKTLEIIIS